nr:cadmium/zinc-transporting ATPase HMA2-like [Populus alba]
MRDTREEVDADEVMLNTVLAVKAGEAIPIDGENCEVDEKTLTGESFPVAKQEDSIVWVGTINLNGVNSVRTTALAEDCVVAKMAKLVEEARNSKSKTQRFIDKFAQYYTPAVIFMPAGVAVIPLALRVHNRDHWFYLALGKIKAMAFDKTGTITRGEFVVTDFHHLGEDLEELQNFPGEGIQGKNEVKNICIDNRKIAHRASGTGEKPYYILVRINNMIHISN